MEKENKELIVDININCNKKVKCRYIRYTCNGGTISPSNFAMLIKVADNKDVIKVGGMNGFDLW